MATTAASVGVPVKVLHEAEGHPVFVEVKTGESYRGMLSTGEGSMNIQLSNVTHTAKDGRSIKLEQVYLRGSQIRMIVLPDILKNAPIFKKVQDFAAAKAKPVATRGGRRGGRGGARAAKTAIAPSTGGR